jgi:hypothetical protein
MKLEIDMISADHEHTLRYSNSVRGILKEATRLLSISHWHDSRNEALVGDTVDELRNITAALDSLHLAWKEAFYKKQEAAAAAANHNPLYIMWYWDAVNKLSVGEPFGVCKRHLPKVHVPAGRTMQKATALPAQEISCKFCEFEEISATALARRSSKSQ